eukprot:2338763-Pyramimonas_sp.AAC.1
MLCKVFHLCGFRQVETLTTVVSRPPSQGLQGVDSYYYAAHALFAELRLGSITYGDRSHGLLGFPTAAVPFPPRRRKASLQA